MSLTLQGASLLPSQGCRSVSRRFAREFPTDSHCVYRLFSSFFFLSHISLSFFPTQVRDSLGNEVANSEVCHVHITCADFFHLYNHWRRLVGPVLSHILLLWKQVEKAKVFG